METAVSLTLQLHAGTEIVRATKSWTTEMLYKKVADLAGIHVAQGSKPKDYFNIYHHSRYIESSFRTLSDYDFVRMDQLTFMPKSNNSSNSTPKVDNAPDEQKSESRPFLQLKCVRVVVDNKQRAVKADENCTSAQLYDRVSEIANIPKFQDNTHGFYLLSKGRRLQPNDSKLKDFEVYQNEEIVLVYRVEGGTDEPNTGSLLRQLSRTRSSCCLGLDFDDTVDRFCMPSCQCVISVDGWKSHAIPEIQKGCYKIKCPGPCDKEYDAYVVLHIIKSELSEDILHQLVERINANYIQQPMNDIRQCGMCKAYCTRDFSLPWPGDRNRVRCVACSRKVGREVDFCWQCGHGWKGGGRVSCGNDECERTIAEKLHILATCPTKSVSYLSGSNCPSIRACPNCGTFVNHKDKCKHMTCPICQLEFCFVCLKCKGEDGKWQCGSFNSECTTAARQISIPTGIIDKKMRERK